MHIWEFCKVHLGPTYVDQPTLGYADPSEQNELWWSDVFFESVIHLLWWLQSRLCSVLVCVALIE